MPAKGLKPTAVSRPSARDALAAADAVAQEEGMPPATLLKQRAAAVPPASEELVQLNIRVRRRLGDQLADRARLEGTTQKVLVCRALRAAGFEVAEEDLRAGPAPRRRGTA